MPLHNTATSTNLHAPQGSANSGAQLSLPDATLGAFDSVYAEGTNEHTFIYLNTSSGTLIERYVQIGDSDDTELETRLYGLGDIQLGQNSTGNGRTTNVNLGSGGTGAGGSLFRVRHDTTGDILVVNAVANQVTFSGGTDLNVVLNNRSAASSVSGAIYRRTSAGREELYYFDGTDEIQLTSGGASGGGIPFALAGSTTHSIVEDAANGYNILSATTSAGAVSGITIGNNDNDPDITLAGNAADVIINGGCNFDLSRDFSVQLDTGRRATFTLTGTATQAFRVHLGGTSYIDVNTLSDYMDLSNVRNMSFVAGGAVDAIDSTMQVSESTANSAFGMQIAQGTFSTASGTEVSTGTTLQIPADATVIAVHTLVETTVTGPTTFNVGVAGDSTRYGSSNLTAGDNNDTPASQNNVYTSATSIVLGAQGGSFSGGVVRVVVHYISTTAPS